MAILSQSTQNASPSTDVWDAIRSFPSECSQDHTPEITDPQHQARFQRLVLSIHRQLSHQKITKPRIKIIPGRTSVRVRARRSPASLRRSTTDSGGNNAGGDPEPEPHRSRRQRQAGALYKDAGSILEYPELRYYLDRHNANLNIAIRAGAKAGTHPAGVDCILWPIHGPQDVLTGPVIGVVCDAPGEDLLIRGKRHVDRRSGGLCFGSLDNASTLYIATAPTKALAICGATGRPTLSLLTPHGIAGISESTIRTIAESKLAVVIAIDERDRAAADACQTQIKLTSPATKVTVTTYRAWGDAFLDAMTESTFTAPPTTPPTRRDTHDDFLACPDLSGGPLGPEPPPIDAPIVKNNVVPLVPWEKLPPKVRPPLPTFAQMQKELDRVVPLALEMAMVGIPVLIKAPPGSGKTHRVLQALKTLRVTRGHAPDYNNSTGQPGLSTEKTERTKIAVRRVPNGTPHVTNIAGGRKVSIGSGMGAFSSIGFGANNTRILLHPTLGTHRARAATFLMLHPTKELSAEGAGVTGGWAWDGRSTRGLCNQVTITDILTNRGRSPQQHACLTCEFGIKPQGPDVNDDRCQFQKNLSIVYLQTGIHGQHGAGGRESTLYKYASDPRDDLTDRDMRVIDEGIPTDITHSISIEDVMSARNATARIDDHISQLRAKAEKKKRSKKWSAAGDEARYTEDDYQAARAWADDMGPTLEVLGGLILNAPKTLGMHPLDSDALADFMRLTKKIPKAAKSLDGTALERVENIWGEDRVVPLAWIKLLRSALERETAWLHVTEKGTKIACTTPSDLYQQFLGKGGVLLDAGCTNDDEIRAAGGCVFDLQCERPKLILNQYGPRGHGRGEGMGTARGRAHTEAEAIELKETLNADPEAVAITHLPIAALLDDKRVEHWGIHKGHNRWKSRRHGIIWGFNIPSPTAQLIGYKTYRQRLAARGIEIEDWNGETIKNEWVTTDTHKLIPAARIPKVKAARDWLIRYINSDLMQAVGRFRDLLADGPVIIDIYGLMPIQGFGLHVNEIRLERSGRAYQKTSARAVIAAGVADLGEARTRAKLMDYFKRRAGKGISKDQCDKLVSELKAQALESGTTLYEAARQSCATNTRLLEAGHEPQAIAQAAREIGGLPGVAAVADLLDQIKRAPGAQRAGP